MKKVTIGGNRLGSGGKMEATMHGYERSTHDLSYIFRTTMAAGTIVPFIGEIALLGDTFDIDLDISAITNPTTGPLFGSFKVQADVFKTALRLYNGKLHMNLNKVGMNMQAIKFAQIQMKAGQPDPNKNMDNQQINPSSIFAYMGIRGLGINSINGNDITRYFNANEWLIYWDCVKNYYANKQEEIGAVIHGTPVVETISTITITNNGAAVTLPKVPTAPANINLRRGTTMLITFAGARPNLDEVIIVTSLGEAPVTEVFGNVVWTGTTATMSTTAREYANAQALQWRYSTPTEARPPQVVTFPLDNIDEMRKLILSYTLATDAFQLNDVSIAPYGLALQKNGTLWAKLTSQEGLAVKTYQSDLFNNWMNTEWIDGENGVNAISAVSTAGGEFTIDALNLSQKVYNLLNRVALSDGSYESWLETVYDETVVRRAENPEYIGGLSKEMVFQEVISNVESSAGADGQPLGTLGGRGVLTNKHKGGKVSTKIMEPSMVTGYISLTPRIDYSQGNKWYVNLKTMDDLHKPALDGIGYQDLITDQMAWWDTRINVTTGAITYKSAGKQPAWINYMTNVNRTYGNFAIEDNEMWMTLNRRYEGDGSGILDLTTYIDPVKFNNIFAQTSRDAQNFKIQIGVKMIVRRKMSAKLIPNL